MPLNPEQIRVIREQLNDADSRGRMIELVRDFFVPSLFVEIQNNLSWFYRKMAQGG